MTFPTPHTTHLEAELQGLEAADGRLREDVAVQRAERDANVGLREPERATFPSHLNTRTMGLKGGKEMVKCSPQLDPSLLELLRKVLEIVRIRVL